MTVQRLTKPPSQVDLPRTELPAEGREQYLDYVIEQIQAKFESNEKNEELYEVQSEIGENGKLQVFGIEITAFANRQEEIDLISRLAAAGYEAKFYARPRKSAFPPLYWFLVKKVA